MPSYDTNRCLDLYKGLERSYNDYPTSNGIVSDHLSAMARYGAEILKPRLRALRRLYLDTPEHALIGESRARAQRETCTRTLTAKLPPTP